MTWAIRPIENDVDGELAWNLGKLAFGGDRLEPYVPNTQDPARHVGLFDGGELVAKLKVRPYKQYFGGRAVAMGGVASVAVSPERRGSGAAKHLLTHALSMMRADGQPISALFPSAVGLYRSMGWELAGDWPRVRVRTIDLARVQGGEDVSIRRCTAQDLPAVQALYTATASERTGMLTRTGPAFPRGVAEILSLDAATVAVRDGAIVGYVTYDRGRGYMEGSELAVHDLVGHDADATSALMRHLATWSSVASQTVLRWTFDDLASLVSLDAMPPAIEQRRWMLRIIDVPRALEARGYRRAVSVRLELEVHDAQADWNSTRWVLEVADGRARVTPGGSGAVQCDVGALASLYASAYSAATLVRSGAIRADARAVDGLDAAFAGQSGVLWDYF